MPQNRRDTLYLESMIGSIAMAMAILCMESAIFVRPVRETTVLTLLASLAPMQLWAATWMVIGALIIYGCITRNYRLLEHASLISAAAWVVVAFYAFSAPRLYPATCAMTPIYSFYSAAIYIYHSRQAAKAKTVARFNNGRSAQPAGG